MVSSAKGFRDWLIQRITAVILAGYTIFLLGYLLLTSQVTYQKWLVLFSNPWMKMGSLLVILSLLVHAWIGIWTALTDYVHCAKALIFLNTLVLLTLISLFFWSVQIFWGL